ncbi:MAG: aminotransferase class III-fold pyridoxal phosphate-dependent enzyme, partial [Bacteroidetes bacterium]|nr:aminotransferase class III-fold pyridoxal phosphate-dependent enzyme [Bacteroidota bacterium]
MEHSHLRDLFRRHIAPTSPWSMALEVDRAEGSYIYDYRGKGYLDFISGISVSIVGHRHPVVHRAVTEQL